MKCVMVIAALDNGGGAGLLQDVRVVEHLQRRAVVAVTGLTNQDDAGVRETIPVEPGFLKRQIALMRMSYPTDAVKIGALFGIEQAQVVGESLRGIPRGRVVLDPVFAPTSGPEFMPGDALPEFLQILAPRVGLLTPNLPELFRIAAVLGLPDCEPGRLAQLVSKEMGLAVYVKGGHGGGRSLDEVFATPLRVERYRRVRLELRYAHGSGCMFSSAVAALHTHGLPFQEACEQAAELVARHYLRINEAELCADVGKNDGVSARPVSMGSARYRGKV
jgi:hydroxymethylpyrimidine/phosphomethylpyrimidine kinase